MLRAGISVFTAFRRAMKDASAAPFGRGTSGRPSGLHPMQANPLQGLFDLFQSSFANASDISVEKVLVRLNASAAARNMLGDNIQVHPQQTLISQTSVQVEGRQETQIDVRVMGTRAAGTASYRLNAGGVGTDSVSALFVVDDFGRREDILDSDAGQQTGRSGRKIVIDVEGHTKR